MALIDVLIDMSFVAESAALTLIAGRLYWALRRKGRAGMTAFQLHPEETRWEFEVLLAAYLVAVMGAVLVVVGEYLGMQGYTTALIVRRAGAAVASGAFIATLYVYYRWMRAVVRA